MFKVKLDICSVKDFVYEASQITGKVTLYSGRYVVDGKSIMGIYSLDLSKPVDAEIEEGAAGEYESLYNRLKELKIIAE